MTTAGAASNRGMVATGSRGVAIPPWLRRLGRLDYLLMFDLHDGAHGIGFGENGAVIKNRAGNGSRWAGYDLGIPGLNPNTAVFPSISKPGRVLKWIALATGHDSDAGPALLGGRTRGTILTYVRISHGNADVPLISDTVPLYADLSLLLEVRAGGRLRCRMHDGLTLNTKQSSGGTWPSGKWVFAACDWGPAGLRLFIDESSWQSVSVTGGTRASSQTIRIFYANDSLDVEYQDDAEMSFLAIFREQVGPMVMREMQKRTGWVAPG